MNEKEHNALCDSLKCKHGNYCNQLTGLCHQCKPLPVREPIKDVEKWCALCDRPIGIYGKGYTHNHYYHIHGRNLCNLCVDMIGDEK
jgi:hypothetical protein